MTVEKDEDYYKALAFFRQRMLSYKLIGLSYQLKRKHAKVIKQEQLRASKKDRLKSRFKVSDIVKITGPAIAVSTGIPLYRLFATPKTDGCS